MFLLAVFMAMPQANAQRTKFKGDNPEIREDVLAELRSFKHDFLKKELNLTPSQEAPFFKAYDEMDYQLMKIGSETRMLERDLLEKSNPTDTELESGARTIFEQKKKEGEIELKYFEEFKKVLTKSQLVKLKSAERTMNRKIISYYRENGGN